MAVIPDTHNTGLTPTQIDTAFSNALTHVPSSSTPAMDGTASAGESDEFARGDHVHPIDTSRQAALTTAQLAAVNSGIDSTKVQQIETNKSNILTLADQSVRYNVLPPNRESTSTNNNVTCTANGDGTLTISTVSGGASANTFFGVGDVALSAEDYVLLGGVSNLLRLQDNTDTYLDTGSGSLMHITTAANYTIYVRVNSGYTNTEGIVIKPRIIPKSVYDAGFTTYQPYAMSNAEITAWILAHS